VVSNAAVQNPNILALLPKYFVKHYGYLKDKYPAYLPVLPLSTTAVKELKETSSQENDVEKFLNSSLSLLKDVKQLIHESKYEEAGRFVKSCARFDGCHKV
jgi:hypothetical protein